MHQGVIQFHGIARIVPPGRLGLLDQPLQVTGVAHRMLLSRDSYLRDGAYWGSACRSASHAAATAPKIAPNASAVKSPGPRPSAKHALQEPEAPRLRMAEERGVTVEELSKLWALTQPLACSRQAVLGKRSDELYNHRSHFECTILPSMVSRRASNYRAIHRSEQPSDCLIVPREA